MLVGADLVTALPSSPCPTCTCKASKLRSSVNPPSCPSASSMQQLDSSAPTPKHSALFAVPPDFVPPVSFGVDFDTPSEQGMAGGASQQLDSSALSLECFVKFAAPPLTLGAELDIPSGHGTTATGDMAAVLGDDCNFPYGRSTEQTLRSVDFLPTTKSRESGKKPLACLSPLLGTTPMCRVSGRIPLRRPICLRTALYFSWSCTNFGKVTREGRTMRFTRPSLLNGT